MAGTIMNSLHGRHLLQTNSLFLLSAVRPSEVWLRTSSCITMRFGLEWFVLLASWDAPKGHTQD
jgi:hypothetical protein